MKPLEKPLTLAEARKLEKDGRLVAVVALDLDEIIDSEAMEGFNEMVDEKLSDGWIMVDISYKPVGVDAQNNVLVEVNCEIDSMGEDEEDYADFNIETDIRLIVPVEELPNSDMSLGFLIHSKSQSEFPVEKDYCKVSDLLSESGMTLDVLLGTLRRFYMCGWIESVE